MAPLEGLLPHIYHERQQEGSMLCAEHAVNNLFQGPYFTTTDLSTIAKNLDEQELVERYDDLHRPRESTNMDDTGFFSVQVLENALQVWGLTLEPWRSEKMRPYHDHPHTQLAFILNCSQHWYTLRRFGRVSPDPVLEADPEGGHWFDLNSFLPEPHWVSKTYLGMTLQQAEAEGYSVFAVTQINPAGPLALPRTEGDEIAASLPEPSAASYQLAPQPRLPTRLPPPVAAPRGGIPQENYGFEDEDLELQAALQASLMDGGARNYAPAAQGQPSQRQHHSVPIAMPPMPASTSSQRGHYRVPTRTPSDPASEVHTPEDFDFSHRHVSRGYDVLRPRNEINDEEQDPIAIQDPVAASRARAQALMEQARREQEAALRDTYEEEQARIRAGLPNRRDTRLQQEEAELQRILEESRVMHETLISRTGRSEEDVDNEYTMPSEHAPRAPAFQQEHRIYDDDDAELQAALKASLESMPPGFTVPSPPPRSQSSAGPVSAHSVISPQPVVEEQQEMETETESEADANADDPAQLSMEEMRRRRLARFGG